MRYKLILFINKSRVQNITLYSIIYPVIGAPPSFSGLVHFKSAWSLSQSTSSTLFGLPGSSKLQIILNTYMVLKCLI